MNAECQTIVFESSDSLTVPIIDTGKRIASITGELWIGLDDKGTEYYIKNRSTSRREQLQLLTLREYGVPVPQMICFNRARNELATSFAGIPIQRSFTSKEQTTLLLSLAGALLSDLHNIFMTHPVLTEDDFSQSAHIVDNFFYKRMTGDKRVSLVNYRDHKNELRQKPHCAVSNATCTNLVRPDFFIKPLKGATNSLRELIDVSNDIAWSLLDRLATFVVSKENGQYLNIQDKGICYGDFKPENILVISDGNSNFLRVIDPVLIKGSMYFDLAKFTSRYILDTAFCSHKAPLRAFFDGYSMGTIPEGPIYGTFNFTELVVMDMLNILKTYIRRFRACNKSYRMTAALDNAVFCKFMSDVLKRSTSAGQAALFGFCRGA